MESTVIKIAVRILRHRGIPFAFVGELALNYYNVPRVRHDLEICVASESLVIAETALLSTGLFETAAPSSLNLYTEYRRGKPRLATTQWITPRQTIVLFPDSFFYLAPLDVSLAVREPGRTYHASDHILETDGLECADLADLPFPRLQPLLVGHVRRFLEAHDDASMVAAEQLVDGMDIDEHWCVQFLKQESAAVVGLIEQLVTTKAMRLDSFSDNEITCFVRDEAAATRVRSIAGYC